MVLDLVIAMALVLANGFFVASEFALARLRPTQVGQFEQDRRAGARSVRHAIEHLDAYLATCQLGITIASIGLGVAGEPAFVKLLSPLLGAEAQIGGIALAATLAFALITLLHVIVGELAPKSIAISRTSGTVLRLAPPMRLFYLATKPLVDLFNAMGNALLRPFHIPSRTRGRARSALGERAARAAGAKRQAQDVRGRRAPIRRARFRVCRAPRPRRDAAPLTDRLPRRQYQHPRRGPVRHRGRPHPPARLRARARTRRPSRDHPRPRPARRHATAPRHRPASAAATA